jgi:ABC-type Fe3+-hydroxamate transport system substrate-binding protein
VRIVSLVPSHSETLVAIGAAESLVGITRYCTEAPSVKELGIPPIGGTKNPDVEEVLARKPDIVIACEEENRIEDIREIERGGVEVIDVSPRSIEQAVEGVLRLGELTGCIQQAEDLAGEIERAATRVRDRASRYEAVLGRIPLYCPIWYRPWMSFSFDTYCNAVLDVCGAKNVYADSGPERYFEADPEDALRRGARAVLLPTEPFRFGRRHAELLEKKIGPSVIVDGSALTWYGARTPWGLATVSDALEELAHAILA